MMVSTASTTPGRRMPGMSHLEPQGLGLSPEGPHHGDEGNEPTMHRLQAPRACERPVHKCRTRL